MEVVGNKQSIRKRKRKRRYIKSKQRQFEVKSEKKQTIVKNCNSYKTKKKVVNSTMEASAFWENYNAAHEWQKRHNTTWWKTRCFALEHENHVLKETIRNLMGNKNCSPNLDATSSSQPTQNKVHTDVEDKNENNTDDNLEFHLNEDMMNFLTQSIRHKVELKNKKDSEAAAEEQKSKEQVIESAQMKAKRRNVNAQLLYGKYSTKILAMETALQTSTERHVDKSKPQYWPNIPLNL